MCKIYGHLWHLGGADRGGGGDGQAPGGEGGAVGEGEPTSGHHTGPDFTVISVVQ